MRMLEVKNLEKIYGSGEGVKNLSLELSSGDFAVIVGPSGSGKSTLLECIAGVQSPDSGEIFIGDEDVTEQPPEDRDTTMIWQGLSLFPNMKVSGNIQFGMDNEGDKEERTSELLELVGLEGYENKNIGQLSRGEKQRVAIARALASEPKILLLDEPFASLDAPVAMKLKNEIKKLQNKVDITFLMVTHDISDALLLADRIFIMRDGHLVESGTTEEIYQSEDAFVSDFIGHQVSVDVLRNEEGIKILFEDMLNYSECKFIAGGSGGGVANIMPEFWEDYNERRKEEGVVWKDIVVEGNFFPEYEEHKGDREYLRENELYEYKIMPRNMEYAPHVIFIYGEKVANVIWTDPPLAFIIENKHVSKNHEEYFEYLWERDFDRFEGREGIKRVIRDLVQVPGETVRIMGSFEEITGFSKSFFEEYHKERIEKKVDVKNLSPDNERERELAEKESRPLLNTRFITDCEELDAELYIYRDKVALASFKDGNPEGVIIEDDQLAKLQEILFESVWTASEE